MKTWLEVGLGLSIWTALVLGYGAVVLSITGTEGWLGLLGKASLIPALPVCWIITSLILYRVIFRRPW